MKESRSRVGVVLAVLAAFGATGADAATWRGCVNVANALSTATATVIMDGYPGSHWTVEPGNSIRYMVLADGHTPVFMQADSSARPPVHVTQPSNAVILWNFFVGGTPDPQTGCVDTWRIVVAVPPCSNVVDNLCR